MKTISIDGNNCKTKNDLFKTFSEAFEFPDYFANNWDSFDEIMGDLSWIPDEEIKLEVADYQDILSDEPEDELDTFYNIISNVEEYSGKTFILELVDADED